MQCANCHRELSDIAVFCPDCGMKVNRPEGPGGILTPAPSAPAFVPAFQPAVPAATQIPDESDYYHIDATERPDFIALRGISIALIVISALSFIVAFSLAVSVDPVCLLMMLGAALALPLSIISLVLSARGNDERDPVRALRTFKRCRMMVIIAAALLLLVIAGIFIADSYYYASGYYVR